MDGAYPVLIRRLCLLSFAAVLSCFVPSLRAQANGPELDSAAWA